MMNRYMEILSGSKMTAVSAFFLLVSLFFMLAEIQLPSLVNPICLTIIISGLPIAYSAFVKLFRCHCISSSLLITTAMVAAIAIGELFAAGEVALIMAVGEILEDATVDKAQKGLQRLIELTPATGRKIINGEERTINLQEIKKGDVLRILAGETIPADGTIIKGSTSVNQAALTGESLPADKSVGDKVMAGTINCFGVIDICVETVKNTYLQRMINLVKEAQNNKAPTERIVDKWAAVLVPAAFFIALLTYLMTGEIIRAVTVLVVFCPCALVLATPTSVMAAVGHAAKNGVLIKSGAALEETGKVDTVVFDKTGTLTTGNLQISDIIAVDKNIAQSQLLSLAAGLEKYSEHTLARAIVQKATALNLTFKNIDNAVVLPGKGISGVFNNQNIYIGNPAFLREKNIIFSNDDIQQIRLLQNEGKAIATIASDKTLAGVIALSDTPRDNIKQTVQLLKSSNLKTVVLTGDNSRSAKYCLKDFDFDVILADLLPEDKARKIKELQQQNHHVCMIGDGINDAPALKTANVGIAMGKIGSDIAVDAADVALINDNPASILYLKKLSAVTIQTIKINISISMLLNFLGIILSFYGLLGPMSGAVVHNLGSVLVVLNAARIYNKQI